MNNADLQQSSRLFRVVLTVFANYAFCFIDRIGGCFPTVFFYGCYLTNNFTIIIPNRNDYKIANCNGLIIRKVMVDRLPMRKEYTAEGINGFICFSLWISPMT